MDNNIIDSMHPRAFQVCYEFEQKFNVALAKCDEDVIEIHKKMKALRKKHFPNFISENIDKHVETCSPLKSKNNRNTENDAGVSPTVLRENDTTMSSNVGSAKPKRMASQMASIKINKQAQIKLNVKMRQPLTNDKNEHRQAKQVPIKTEKIAPEQEANNENMPPPKTFKPRGRRPKIKNEDESSDNEGENYFPKSTRSNRAINKDNAPVRSSRKGNKKDSDVILIQEKALPIIEIIDTDTEDESKKNEDTSNINETTTISLPEETKTVAIEETKKDASKEPELKKNEESEEVGRQKHLRSWSSEDEDEQAKKRTKKVTKTKKTITKILPDKKKETVPYIPIENIKQERSLYEDGLSESKESNVVKENEKICNATFQVCPSQEKESHLNETVTISKGNVVNSTFVMNSSVNIQKANTPINDNDMLKEKGFKNCVVVLGTLTSDHDSNETDPTSDVIHSSAVQNCTVVLEKIPTPNKNIGNETIVIQKSNTNVSDKTMVLSAKENSCHWQQPPTEAPVLNHEPLLTEDDSDDSPLIRKVKTTKKLLRTPEKIVSRNLSDSIEKKTPNQTEKKPKKAIKTKPMFSPYANSPIKKRVAAFEKLCTETAPVTRVTRTKTRNLLAEKEIEQQKQVKKIPPPKYNTPMASNILKSLIPNTDGKPFRPAAIVGAQKQQNISVASTATSYDSILKTNSVIKLTRMELQEKREEDQKKRLEKEDDVKRKKDAMMQAKIDEQKKIRQEKQIRAQKTREEKEKQKEEKLRLYLAEKEEKQQEELLKKKAYQAMKAAELEEQRKVVEQNRIAKMKELEEQKKLMKKQHDDITKKNQQLLPLPNSESEESDDDNTPTPEWGQRQNIYPKLRMLRHLPEQFVLTFFDVKPTTPDLQAIFERIDQRLLKRNSSAVWRTPPRY